MRVVTFVSTMLASMTLAMALHACKDDLDCKALCKEAQSGDCTAIDGDCDDFCASLGNIQDEAGCSGERNAYEGCLNDGGVCDADCDNQEGDLTTCLTVYCATRLTDTDCVVLVESF